MVWHLSCDIKLIFSRNGSRFRPYRGEMSASAPIQTKVGEAKPTKTQFWAIGD